ncbi:MAG: hypothetical protein ABEJ57_08860 [Halobacteriaceae archaeon]
MVDPSDDGVSWPLRRGEKVTIEGDALLVDKGEDTRVRVELDDLMEVTRREMDWFTGVLSVVLIGIGLYLTQDHVLGGLGFAAAGVVSVYLTYRRRDEINLRIRGRTKPLKVYPENGARFYADLGELLAVEDARVAAEEYEN